MPPSSPIALALAFTAANRAWRPSLDPSWTRTARDVEGKMDGPLGPVAASSEPMPNGGEIRRSEASVE